jgi:hypothetical protein
MYRMRIIQYCRKSPHCVRYKNDSIFNIVRRVRTVPYENDPLIVRRVHTLPYENDPILQEESTLYRMGIIKYCKKSQYCILYENDPT